MIFCMAAIAGTANFFPHREPGWIYKASWDLPWLIGSAALVPLPFLVAWAAQALGLLTQKQAIDVVNITVAALIGGPHLFSTITYTFLDGKFRDGIRGMWRWRSCCRPRSFTWGFTITWCW